MSFLFKGIIQNLYAPRNEKLIRALCYKYNVETCAAISCEIALTHFKDSDDLIWSQCAERDEVIINDEELVVHYNNMWGEFIMPVALINNNMAAALLLEFDTVINLTKPIELCFTSTELELPTKTLKNFQLLRSRHSPYRLLHTMHPSMITLSSITYL